MKLTNMELAVLVGLFLFLFFYLREPKSTVYNIPITKTEISEITIRPRRRRKPKTVVIGEPPMGRGIHLRRVGDMA